MSIGYKKCFQPVFFGACIFLVLIYAHEYRFVDYGRDKATSQAPDILLLAEADPE
jgi:hypothetical protein